MIRTRLLPSHLQAGFTLIELIVAMMLLSIMAVATSKLIANYIEHFIATNQQAAVTNQARLIVERMSRELREALPLSVRKTSNAHSECIEFIPIIAGSNYYGSVANTPIQQLQVLPFEDGVPASYVAIDPSNSSFLYSNLNQGNIAQLQSIAPASGQTQQLNFSTTVTFSSDSTRSRVYLIAQPVSFCVNSLTGYLTRHADYGFNTQQSLFPTAQNKGQLLASQLLMTDNNLLFSLFTVRPDSLLLSTMISLDIRLREQEQLIRVNHDIYLRNVP